MKVEIECPYCNKIHVHRIAEPKPEVEVQDSLPVDPETEDLKEHLEVKK